MLKARKIFPLILPILMIAPLLFAQPTFATDSTRNVTETILFGNVEDDSEGCGVYMILNLILEILTYGVAIAAAIGITISGITYLTAKGNEQQTTKAKRRIYEIVIGLAAYAVLYAALSFFLPGGRFNTSSTCKIISDSELAAIREEENEQQNNPSSNSGSGGSSPSKPPSSNQQSTSLKKWYTAMNEQFKYMKNAVYGSNYKSDFKLSKKAGTCITFVSTSLQRLGVIPKNTYIWYNCGMVGTAKKHIKKHKDTFAISYPNQTAKQLNKKGKIKKGDIVFYQTGSCGVGHVMVFMGFNKSGKPTFNTWGRHRALGKTYSSYTNKKIKMIIRLKKTTL